MPDERVVYLKIGQERDFGRRLRSLAHLVEEDERRCVPWHIEKDHLAVLQQANEEIPSGDCFT